MTICPVGILASCDAPRKDSGSRGSEACLCAAVARAGRGRNEECPPTGLSHLPGLIPRALPSPRLAEEDEAPAERARKLEKDKKWDSGARGEGVERGSSPRSVCFSRAVVRPTMRPVLGVLCATRRVAFEGGGTRRSRQWRWRSTQMTRAARESAPVL